MLLFFGFVSAHLTRQVSSAASSTATAAEAPLRRLGEAPVLVFWTAIGSPQHRRTRTHTRMHTAARLCSTPVQKMRSHAAHTRTVWGSEADHMIRVKEVRGEEEEWRLGTPCTNQVYSTFIQFIYKISGFSKALMTHHDDMMWSSNYF